MGPGGQEVDHVVEEIHSRGYTVADDEPLGPDLGRCFVFEEIFKEMGDEDENSWVNGRRRRTCHCLFGGN